MARGIKRDFQEEEICKIDSEFFCHRICIIFLASLAIASSGCINHHILDSLLKRCEVRQNLVACSI